MPEPLKNLYTREFLKNLSNHFSVHYPEFPQKKFLDLMFDQNWDKKELKQRLKHISLMLHEVLPEDYHVALEIMKKVAPIGSGFLYMFFPDYVETFGINDEDTSLEALGLFTRYSSSEFAIRPFIVQNEEKVMKLMLQWAHDENHHLRRLASEGCRPRLPWAMALPNFKKDPTLILPILETLKYDQSEYVRKSVANNLNDISKDHPDLVLQIAREWKGISKETDWIIKHGCRTMLKKGNSAVLQNFNYLSPINVLIDHFTISSETIPCSGTLEFSFQLKVSATDTKLRLEYAIYFLRGKHQLTKKVFKIKEGTFNSKDEYRFLRKHSFKPITTRKYYAGIHKIALIVNGVEYQTRDFHLLAPII